MEKSKGEYSARKIDIAKTILQEITPIVSNTIHEIEKQKDMGCSIRCRVRGGKSSVIIDINQEVDQFKIPLITDQWDVGLVKGNTFRQIETFFRSGGLDTICDGVDDFVRLKIKILPGYWLSISAIFSRTETIDLFSGERKKERCYFKVQSEADRQRLIEKSLEIIDESLLHGISKLKTKQDDNCGIGYSPEFFVHRDRLGKTEKYELLNGMLLGSPKQNYSTPKTYPEVINLITQFLDKEIQVVKTKQAEIDYAVSITLRPEGLELESNYHGIILHRCNSQSRTIKEQ